MNYHVPGLCIFYIPILQSPVFITIKKALHSSTLYSLRCLLFCSFGQSFVSWLDSYVLEIVLSYFKFGLYHLLDFFLGCAHNFSGSVVGFVFVVIVFETIVSREIVSFPPYGESNPYPSNLRLYLESASISILGAVIIHIVRFLQCGHRTIPPGEISMENPVLLPTILAR